MERRVIVVKKYVMGNPNLGKLQPLMYADGTPIQNLYYEFPNGGDIFVTGQFGGIPEDPVEISVEVNDHFGDTTDMRQSKIIYSPRTCQLQSIAGRIFDVIPVSAFPTGQTDLYLDLEFYPTQYFFLQESDNEEIRGPFKRGECTLQEGSWRTPIILPSPSEAIVKACPLLTERLVGAFKESELPPSVVQRVSDLRSFQLEYDERKFIIDFAEVAWLINSDPDNYYVDLMADHDLVTWLNIVLRKEFELNKEDIQRFRQTVIALGEQESQYALPGTVIRDRISRAKAYLASVEEAQEVILDFIEDQLSHFLASQPGQEALANFVRTKREDIMSDLLDEVLEMEEATIAETKAKLVEEIESLKAGKVSLQEELTRLSEQTDQAKQEATAELRAKAFAELEQLGTAIKEKKTELEELQEHLEISADLQRLKEETKELRDERKYLEQVVEEQRRTKQSLIEELHQTDLQLRDKLLRQKLYLETLSGTASESEGIVPSKGFWVPVHTENQPVEDILKVVAEYFRANGRDVTIPQVANYVISILQNRLTIFVGYPGVGKSSTIQLLAESLGMCQGDAERLLKVSVGRGWVSSRDLIGFHNPLTHSFQAAPTGIFGALKALQEERVEEKPGVPLWILLDEINLSPVEHYWSDFMTTTDSTTGSIRCGSERLVFDHALRFVGTANYDETTEPLSPRVVSRANIIYVAPPESRTFRFEENGNAVAPARVFTFEQLRPLWDVHPEHTEAEQILVNQLVSYLQRPADEQGSLGPITVVDPRVRKSIAMYCAAARKIMGPELGEFGALDYTVSQRVLPQCRGTGQGYARRLEQVRELCRSKQLTKSIQTIDRILEQGQLYQSYDFFGL